MTRNVLWVSALILAMLGAALLSAPAGLAQDEPPSRETASDGPRPGEIGEPAAPIATRHVYDTANLLNAEQEAAIEADATRLQRFGVPSVVIVQFNELSPDAAASFAAEVRRQWHVESEPGADDGLVMLISVPDSEGTISTTLSWGERAFPNDGLTGPIAATIKSAWLDARIADGQLYEGILFGLRRMIYHSIYDPAPLQPLTTAQRIGNIAIDIIGPLLVLGGFVLATMALRARHPRRAAASPILVWGVPTAALVTAVVAIWSRSGWGIAASLALLAVVAVLWVRRDPGGRGDRQLTGTVTS